MAALIALVLVLPHSIEMHSKQDEDTLVLFETNLPFLISMHCRHESSFILFLSFLTQVLDGQYHIFVLEGLTEKGVRRLWEKLPRPQEEGTITLHALTLSLPFSSLLPFNFGEFGIESTKTPVIIYQLGRRIPPINL